MKRAGLAFLISTAAIGACNGDSAFIPEEEIVADIRLGPNSPSDYSVPTAVEVGVPFDVVIRPILACGSDAVAATISMNGDTADVVARAIIPSHRRDAVFTCEGRVKNTSSARITFTRAGQALVRIHGKDFTLKNDVVVSVPVTVVPPMPTRSNEPVQTDTTDYLATPLNSTSSIYSFRVITRFRNTLADTVFLGRCYPDSPTPIYSVALLSPTDPQGAAYNEAWACVGHENPIGVAPGVTRVDTLQLRGPTMFSGGKGFGATAGTFRIQYSTKSCRKEIGCPSTLMGTSNAFRVMPR